MMRVPPCRLMPLQCSQIGFTLLRTFTSYSLHDVGKRAGALSFFPRLAFEITYAGRSRQALGMGQRMTAREVNSARDWQPVSLAFSKRVYGLKATPTGRFASLP